MTASDVEDRIRHTLADLAATTTTSVDTAERIEQRARPRGSRVRVASSRRPGSPSSSPGWSSWPSCCAAR